MGADLRRARAVSGIDDTDDFCTDPYCDETASSECIAGFYCSAEECGCEACEFDLADRDDDAFTGPQSSIECSCDSCVVDAWDSTLHANDARYMEACPFMWCECEEDAEDASH